MKDSQYPTNYVEEVKGLNISVWYHETQSNGYRGEIETLELLEIMRILKMDV